MSARPVLPEPAEPPASGTISPAGTVLTLPIDSPDLQLLNQRSLAERATAAYLAQAALFSPLLTASLPKP